MNEIAYNYILAYEFEKQTLDSIVFAGQVLATYIDLLTKDRQRRNFMCINTYTKFETYHSGMTIEQLIEDMAEYIQFKEEKMCKNNKCIFVPGKVKTYAKMLLEKKEVSKVFDLFVKEVRSPLL